MQFYGPCYEQHFIFSGVICLTLDPVAQSDCHGPSGKDFQLTKTRSHRAHTSISPLHNLAPGLLQHVAPLRLCQHQLCPCPPLQTTKLSLVSGPYLKRDLGLLLFTIQETSECRSPPAVPGVKQPSNSVLGNAVLILERTSLCYKK